MKRVYFHAPGERWIVDRFKTEWDLDNANIAVQDPRAADVLWINADWCWRQIPVNLLSEKKVLVTVHHIVPDKFGPAELNEFQLRDDIVDAYHVPNKHTFEFIRPLTKKPIHMINYWANQHIWHKTGERNEFRVKHNIPLDAYVVGSFQRDTEGAGILRGVFEPKREKGPDLFADYVEDLVQTSEDQPMVGYPGGIHVLLAGWRRQYLIQRFKAFHVPFSYIEMPSQETLNELYQTLDLYPITARQEGGPQAFLECGLLDVLVVSRYVGMAEDVLAPISVSDNLIEARPTVPNVEHLKLPHGYEPYRKLLASL